MEPFLLRQTKITIDQMGEKPPLHLFQVNANWSEFINSNYQPVTTMGEVKIARMTDYNGLTSWGTGQGHRSGRQGKIVT
jgi:hypothetical protein